MGCGITIEKVNCDLQALQRSQAVVNAALTEIQNQQVVVYGAGTAYDLTDTSAAVDLGTTDPSITLDEPGTYLLLASAQLEYVGATVAAETAALKLRRTNNTPADVGNSEITLDLPAATTLTHTYGVFNLPPVLYTTTNSDDVISLFGNISAALGAGEISVSDASIVAVRLK